MKMVVDERDARGQCQLNSETSAPDSKMKDHVTYALLVIVD